MSGRKRAPGPRAGASDTRGPLTQPSVPAQGTNAAPRGLFHARGLAARPRIAALIIALIGFVMAEVNRLAVRNERQFYPMLMLFGPACILFGIAGAIDPRVMNQAGIQEPRTLVLFRAIMVAVVLAGLAIGWAMAHFWYKIW